MIENDSKFLRNHNLIDYSLLLVIEHIDENNMLKISYGDEFDLKDNSNRHSSQKHEGYFKYHHIGIIDYL